MAVSLWSLVGVLSVPAIPPVSALFSRSIYPSQPANSKRTTGTAGAGGEARWPVAMGIEKAVQRKAASQRPREDQSETTEIQPMRNRPPKPFPCRQDHAIKTLAAPARGARPGACARASLRTFTHFTHFTHWALIPSRYPGAGIPQPTPQTITHAPNSKPRV